MIRADHQKVEDLYQRYADLDGQWSAKQALVEQICQELEVHAKLEEEIFYPAVQTKLRDEGTDLVSEALKEHGEMKRLIGQLREQELAEADYDRTVYQLMAGVQHHVQEEEEEMLPHAEQEFGPDLDGLGFWMQQRKQELLSAVQQAGQPGHGTLAQRMTVADKEVSDASTIE
jgi:hemerythrin superfamily protein